MLSGSMYRGSNLVNNFLDFRYSLTLYAITPQGAPLLIRLCSSARSEKSTSSSKFVTCHCIFNSSSGWLHCDKIVSAPL
jgi:hypothetical protein